MNPCRWLGALALVLAAVWPVHAQPATQVRLSAGSVAVAPGATATVDVLIEGATNLGSFQFALNYDPAVVEVQGIRLGEMLGSTGRQASPLGPRTDRPGETVFGAFSLGAAAPGASGSGRLATVQLSGKARATAALALTRVQVTDVQGQTQPVSVTTAPGSSAESAPGAHVGPQPAWPALAAALGVVGIATGVVWWSRRRRERAR